MKIEKTSYRQLGQAYRCTVGSLELIVATEIGPRIISFGFTGGENILYNDETGLSCGDWKIYGGHRFTVAPESSLSYEPDNDPCEVVIEKDSIRIIAPATASNIQKIIEIAPGNNGDGFEIRHAIKNVGPVLLTVAPWTITCVKLAENIILPWGSGPDQWRNHKVCYLNCNGKYAAVNSSQWQPSDDLFVVCPNGEAGKIGIYSDAGAMAWLGAESTFVKRTKAFSPDLNYPDGGCNAELYTCERNVEMEFLGPIETVYPGCKIEISESWQLISKSFTPDQWRTVFNYQ